jgi:hypothetical protein
MRVVLNIKLLPVAPAAEQGRSAQRWRWLVDEVILTLQSDNGRHRAQVVKISDTAFRVEVERLMEAFDAGGFKRGEFWSSLNAWTSYTDNMERAAELAAENLRLGEACE